MNDLYNINVVINKLKKCKVINCNNKYHSKGYCEHHLYKFKRYGDPLFVTKYRNLPKCKIEGCNKIHHCKGLCKKHYKSQFYILNILKIKIYRENQYIKTRNHILDYQRNYRIKNPEKLLKWHIEHLTKYGKLFNLKYYEYSFALMCWALSVKKRDNYTCQTCGNKEDLEAHHILYKSKYPMLSLNINNGITQCEKCHLEVHGKNLFK